MDVYVIVKMQKKSWEEGGRSGGVMGAGGACLVRGRGSKVGGSG